MATSRETDRKPKYVRPMTRKQGWALFDQEARRSAGVSGEEFIHKWDAGEYDDPDDKPGIMRVGMLLPLARASGTHPCPPDDPPKP